MKKILMFVMLIGLAACAKPVRPQPIQPAPEARREHGLVVYAQAGNRGEWQLIDSEGNRLSPVNLSSALKIHQLRVYFSYEKISPREDGVTVVRLISIAIE